MMLGAIEVSIATSNKREEIFLQEKNCYQKNFSEEENNAPTLKLTSSICSFTWTSFPVEF